MATIFISLARPVYLLKYEPLAEGQSQYLFLRPLPSVSEQIMIRLVAFDMDGTLTQEASSWDTLFRIYGHDPKPLYRLYMEGHIDQDEWAASNLREIILAHPDLTAREIEDAIIQNTHLRVGVQECISTLTSLGVKCVIISAGAEPLARWIGVTAKFHDWKANWFEIGSNGRLVPNYIRKVSYLEKEKGLRSWMEENKISKEETVAVGDSCNDVGMFLESGHSIAFNPTDEYASTMGEVIHEGDDLRICLDTIVDWNDL
ncbi:MAG: HAD family phosphatase [Methanomassiliicoccus sp.]|nr:HAD family phosphatase [Methanomassiliicoccus sp.]